LSPLERALLAVIASRSGCAGLAFARRPESLAGGYWAEISAFSLAAPPRGFAGELILRRMPSSPRTRIEIAVHTAASELGPDQWFPTVMGQLVPQLQGVLFLVYTAGLMFVLRFYFNGWAHHEPIRALLVCSAILCQPIHSQTAAQTASPTAINFSEWIQSRPELLDRKLLARYYSPGRLETPEARAGWVEPDLAPLGI